MALETFEAPEHADPNLNPSYWHNQDKAQVHIFESTLKNRYPFMKERFPRIWAKPGRVTVIPHKYYTVNSRDGTPCKGAWVIGEMVEDAAPAALSHGDAMGHED